MLITPSPPKKIKKILEHHPLLPQFIPLNNAASKLSSSVRDLGVIFDNTLSFEQHISNIYKITYLELRRISSIRQYLSIDATKIFISLFVLSHLDYSSSLLA